MGSVYRALDPDGQPVALKVLHALPGQGPRRDQVRRLRREAEALLRLDHPHAVRLRAALDEPRGQLVLVLELVEGGTLDQLLQRSGALPVEDVIQLGLDLAGALDHAHGLGILHRDLKPSNVLLEQARSGAPLKPRLSDFGLSKFLVADGHSKLTRTGQLTGTPAFWAPEQAQAKAERLGPATDVFGLAGLLYYALTLCPPYGESASLVEAITKFERPLTPARQLRPETPLWLDRLLARALAVEVSDRPPTAAAFARELELGSAGSGSPGAGPRPRVAVLAGSMIALAGLFSAGLLVLAARPAPSRPYSRAPSPPGGETGPGSAVRAALDEGAAHAAAGRHEAAVAAYDEALALNPAEARAWCNRGLSLNRLGRLPAALASLDEALRLDPAHHHAHSRRGNVLGQLRRYDEALAAFRAAQQGLPDDNEALCGEAAILLTIGRRPEALALIDRCLAIDPDHVPALTLLGALQLQTRPEEAYATLARAHAAAPDELQVRSQLGVAAYKLGRVEEAERHLNAVLARDPGFGPARQALGRLFSSQQRWQEALPLVRDAAQRSPARSELHNDLGNVFAGLGRDREALLAYDRALDADPDNAQAARNRGFVLRRLGRLDEAQQSLRRALEAQPDYYRAAFDLATLELERGRLEAARDAFRLASRLEPGNPEPIVGYAASLVSAGREVEAETYYLTALALQPEDFDAALGLAICRNELSRHAAALEVIEPITERSDAPGQAFAVQGSALLGLNRPEEAVASYRAALRREPDDPAAYVGLAQAWEGLGRPDQAWAACLRALELDPELAQARRLRDRLAASRDQVTPGGPKPAQR